MFIAFGTLQYIILYTFYYEVYARVSECKEFGIEGIGSVG